VQLGSRSTSAELTEVIRQGAGRMPSFESLPEIELEALERYLLKGEDVSAVAPVPHGLFDRLKSFVKNLFGRPELVDPLASHAPTYRFTGYRRFLDPDGYPAVIPPWGTLNAINLDTGEYAWRVPLGEYPALTAMGLRNTGSENYGGPIVTAGGLVFIGATNFDKKFRAFDKTTGELLWETTLPFSGNATPITYKIDGRQFVVIAAGGGKSDGPTGGVYVAFALPISTAAKRE
jgi:quinoprotein glucose dehydrogenase